MSYGISASDGLELDDMLASMVAGQGSIAWRAIDASQVPMLTSAEAAVVARAVPQRKAEFATGRSLLRELLNNDVEILRSASGAPILPGEFVGSIAHDHGLAIGVIAPSSAIGAVGVDVEPIHDLDDNVAEIIVRHDDVTPDPLTAFVAKEAAYKTWSVLGGELLEHHDVRVVVEGDRYWADLRGELVVTGEIGRAAGRIIACVFSPAI